jgi:hypothetical protein
MLTSYEGNDCFIIPKTTLRCLKTVMFCFVEDNKIISDIVTNNYGTGLNIFLRHLAMPDDGLSVIFTTPFAVSMRDFNQL